MILSVGHFAFTRVLMFSLWTIGLLQSTRIQPEQTMPSQPLSGLPPMPLIWAAIPRV
jgi:hypothetical protein